MGTINAQRLASDFATLQGQVVRAFLNEYRPTDTETFRDVPNGTLVSGARTWTHRRHGAGVLFVSNDGLRVNAHVAMAEFPEGMDGGRLFEYAESLGLTSAQLDGHDYAVEKPDFDRMLEAMAQMGLVRAVASSGTFSHRIYVSR